MLQPKEIGPYASSSGNSGNVPYQSESESELFTSDTSKDNHSPGRTIIHQSWQPATLHLPARSSSMPQQCGGAASFVMNDYTTRTPGCVTRMQDSLGWDILQTTRLNNRLSMLYKIDYKLVDVKKEKYLQSGDSRTRGGSRFYHERTISEVYRNFFFPENSQRLEQASIHGHSNGISGRIPWESARQTHQQLAPAIPSVNSFKDVLICK